jgi:hypothetical protein
MSAAGSAGRGARGLKPEHRTVGILLPRAGVEH